MSTYGASGCADDDDALSAAADTAVGRGPHGSPPRVRGGAATAAAAAATREEEEPSAPEAKGTGGTTAASGEPGHPPRG